MFQFKPACLISALSAVLLLSACSSRSNGDEFLGYWALTKDSPVRFANIEITKTDNKYAVIVGNAKRYPASYDQKKQTLTIFSVSFGDIAFSYNSSTHELSGMGAIFERVSAAPPVATHAAVAATQPADRFDHPNCSSTRENGGSSSEATPDVRGVRVGMSLDSAVLHLECLDPSESVARQTGTNGFEINYYGHTIRTHVDISVGRPRSAAELAHTNGYYQTDPGSAAGFIYHWGLKHIDATYHLVTFGKEGSERVYGVEQQQTFDTGSQPTVANAESSLIAKYGAPSKRDEGNFEHILVWVYDPSGRVVGTDSPLANSCAIEGSIDAGGWRSNCGLTTVAEVGWSRENPLLATDLSVGLVNQGPLVSDALRMSAVWKAQNLINQQNQAAKAATVKTKL